jgi:hypothetical protein
LSIDSIDTSTRKSQEEIIEAISDPDQDILILDGLQRTHSLLDIEKEISGKEKEEVRSFPIRIEVYLGLNKIGILYRMLTLNTGQTPMSLRQQIEMLYQDYYKSGVNGVEFIREVDSGRAASPEKYNFKEVISGFNSYLERNEQPLERSDILENIRSLEKLSHENNKVDLFEEYVVAYSSFVKKIADDFNGVCLSSEDVSGTPWGKDVIRCFKREQAYAGFGAGVGKLKDHKVIEGLEDVEQLCESIEIGCEPKDFLIAFNRQMDWISGNTKKIGNAQRLFFQFYFRDLFNKEGDVSLNLFQCIESAAHKTKIQLF